MKLKIKKKKKSKHIFREHFNYHSHSFFVKDLHEGNKNKNEAMITSETLLIVKTIPGNENLKKQSILLKTLINNKKVNVLKY